MRNIVKVFTGGTILTMADEMSVEAVTVLNGKICCVGSLTDCRKMATSLSVTYEEVDLQGKCLIPGLIDAHCHMMMRGMSLLWVDVGYPKVKSIKDLIDVLRKFAKTLPVGATIRGFGFDHRNLIENRYPTSKELDKVSDNRPVQIMHVSGHVNVINTFYLNRLGIDKQTPEPYGGTIGRDNNGNPNGQLYDAANDLLADKNGVKIGNHGPNFHTPDTQENLLKIVELGQDEFLSNGITMINDVQVTKQELYSYLVARDNGLLNIRIVGSILSNHQDDLTNLGICSELGDEKLSIASFKTYIDGAINAGTAYMSTKYADGIAGHGYLFHHIDKYKEMIAEANKFGLQTLTHAQGDLAIEIAIEAIEEALNQYPRTNARHRVEHSSFATEEQVKRMSESGIIPVPQPHNFYERGEALIEAYGEDRVRNISPYGWFKKHGVPVIISSDSPVANVNTINGIYAAVTRKTMQGTFIGGEEHQLTIEEALKAYTIEAARSIFKENIAGSIEIGKLADFAVLDKNPLEVSSDELINLSIMETWVGGEKVFSR